MSNTQVPENLTNEAMSAITETELPNVISQQYAHLVETDRQVQLALTKCEESRKKAELQVASKGLGKNDAINSTQDAVRSIADAQDALATAQKMLFQNQQKMADGMRFLLMLGASSVAMNRIVIEQLQLKLSEAAKEELSENARNELMGVIKMLKEQESAFSQQERLAVQISETKKVVLSHEQALADIHHIDEEQSKKDTEHDTLIAQSIEQNALQEEELLRQQEADRKHDALLKKTLIMSVIGICSGGLALILAIVGLFV